MADSGKQIAKLRKELRINASERQEGEKHEQNCKQRDTPEGSGITPSGNVLAAECKDQQKNGPPCGLPSVVAILTPFSITPLFKNFLIS